MDNVTKKANIYPTLQKKLWMRVINKIKGKQSNTGDKGKLCLRVTRAFIRIMSKRKRIPNQPNQETSDDPKHKKKKKKKTTAAQVTRAKIGLGVTRTIRLKFRPRFKFRIRLTFMFGFRLILV